MSTSPLKFKREQYRDCILSNEFYQIYQDRSGDSIVFVWLKKPNNDELKSALTSALDVYKNIGGSWITNAQAMGPVDISSEEWIEEVWFPRLLEMGLPRMATIIPESRYMKLKNTEPLKPYREWNFLSAFFYTETDARNWLRKEQLAHAV